MPSIYQELEARQQAMEAAVRVMGPYAEPRVTVAAAEAFLAFLLPGLPTGVPDPAELPLTDPGEN